VHTFCHVFVGHINNGLVVDMTQTMMPSFEVRDSSGDEGVLDEGRSYVNRVQVSANGGDFPRCNSGSRAVGDPATFAIKVGNKFLRS